MKRVAFVTFGCKVNQYETQALREGIAARGYREVGADDDADVYVINTCTVTQNAYKEAERLVRRIHRRRPAAEVTVTGCAADSNRTDFLGLPGVRRVVTHDEKSALPLLLDDPRLTPADLAPSIFDLGISRFDGHTRAFLKIQDGCDLNCSFCIIPRVRGKNVSRPIDEAATEAERLVANGYREIVLTGVHLGSFGKDAAGRSLLPDLVARMLAIPGLGRVRLSSIEVNEIDDELLRVMAGSGGRFCPHFHLPMQAGDDEVLRAMRRRYNRSQFLRAVDRIRAAVPDPALTTDVIVGFPGETDAQFGRSLALCRETGMSRVHVFPYSHRAGTDASGLPDLPTEVKQDRRDRLEALAEDLAQDYGSRFIGRDVEVLVEHDGGYTERYVRATVEGARGELVRARGVSFDDGILTCKR